MALRASSAGSGRTTRSSSVCHTRSMFSARRMSRRRRSDSMTGVSRRAAMRRSLLRTERRAASVGVRGEDGPDVEVADGVAQVLGVGVLQPVGRTGEQSALGGALGTQLAAAVDLLGDVGEMEVGGEGADQLGRGLQFGAAQQLGGGLAVLSGESAYLLDEFQQLGAFLPDEGLSEGDHPAGGCRRATRCWSSWWSGRRHCSQVRLLAVLKLVWEGTRTASRAAGAAYGPDVREEFRADRAVRPTPG